MGVDEIPITADELKLKSKNVGFANLAIEHTIPVLPNFRLQYTHLKSDGYAVVEREFTLDGVTFPANAPTTTNIDLSQVDLTLYYEILDSFVSLDLGLSAKKIDGEASVVAEPAGLEAITEKTELDGTLPLLYTSFRFDWPLSDFYMAAHVHYMAYDGSKISDSELQFGWQHEGQVDLGVELGLRQFKIKLDDFEDTSADLRFSGPLLALTLGF